MNHFHPLDQQTSEKSHRSHVIKLNKMLFFFFFYKYVPQMYQTVWSESASAVIYGTSARGKRKRVTRRALKGHGYTINTQRPPVKMAKIELSRLSFFHLSDPVIKSPAMTFKGPLFSVWHVLDGRGSAGGSERGLRKHHTQTHNKRHNPAQGHSLNQHT